MHSAVRSIRATALLICAATFLTGCITHQTSDTSPTDKLQSIRIRKDQLSCTPKEIVAQLNRLSKKYDFPNHTGVNIRFDPQVDSEPCSMAIASQGRTLQDLLSSVCESCGSRFEIVHNVILIKLSPLSEKQTPNLDASLPSGVMEICQKFRAAPGKDRSGLARQLFEVFPHSPITWQKDVPMHSYRSYDYEHPSYVLYKRDVIILLGPPDRNVNNQRFFYSAGRWEFGVEFGRYDFVINLSLTGH